MTLVTDLPLCICLLFGEYLTSLSVFQEDFLKAENLQAWRNFCNCSRSLGELKRKAAIYNLDIVHSPLYLCNGKFHQPFFKKEFKIEADLFFDWKTAGEGISRLCSFITDSSKQILLNMEIGYKNELRHIIFSSGAQEKKFWNTFSQRFSTVAGVLWRQRYEYHTADMNCRPIVVKLPYLKTETWEKRGFCVKPSTSLSLSEDIPLFAYRVSFDVSVFKSCQELSIVTHEDLVDVRCLSNVPKIRLENCQKLADVSSLRNAKFLDLTNCDNINDVSMLGNVHTLILRGCSGVSDLSSLECVKHLNICGFGERYHHLEKGLPPRNCVEALWINPPMLQEAEKINAVSQLHVLINDDHAKQLISSLNYFQKVNLLSSRMMRIVSDISTIRELTLYDFVQLREVRNLPSLTHLTVEGQFTRVVSCPQLSNLPKLRVLNLCYVQDNAALVLLPAIRTVSLKKCFLTFLQLEANLNSLVISNCDGFEAADSMKIKNEKKYKIKYIRISKRNEILVEKWN
jgi:hypothetical protein